MKWEREQEYTYIYISMAIKNSPKGILYIYIIYISVYVWNNFKRILYNVDVCISAFRLHVREAPFKPPPFAQVYRVIRR